MTTSDPTAPPPSKPPSKPAGTAPAGTAPAPSPADAARANAAVAAPAEDTGLSAIEIARARARRGKRSWIWSMLPVAGLLVIPAVGLFYTATTSFGKGADSAAAGSAEADEDAPPGTKKTRGASSSKRTKTSKTSHPRNDSAGPCCLKLRELGTTLPVEERGRYLSAATTCEGAPDSDVALKRVNSNLKVGGAEVPAECELPASATRDGSRPTRASRSAQPVEEP